MENIKRIELIIGVCLLIIPLAILGLNFFKKKAVALNDQKIAVFNKEEHTYYFKKALRGQYFEIFTTEDAILEYTLVNSKGNKIRPVIKQTGNQSYILNPPIFGYTSGERYTLSLGSDVFFLDESLENAKTLIFAIEKEAIELATLIDEVIRVEEVIIEVADDLLEIEGFNGTPGDLVYGLNKTGDSVAYKIKEVNEDGTFTSTFPAVEEIYSALEVYGEYELDFNDTLSNPKLETEIVSQIKNSDFYSALVMKAYKEVDNENIAIFVEIVEDAETKMLVFKIGLTIKPGENGLFGVTTFKEHKVKLTLKAQIQAQVDLDIKDILNWDISTTLVEDLRWNIEIAAINQKDSQLRDILALERKEDVKVIVQALNEITADEANSTIELFEHNLLIPEIPGFTLKTKIKLDFQFKFKANILFNTNYTTISTVGLSFADQEYSPYSYFSHKEKNGLSSVKGDVTSQIGLLFDFNLILFHEEIAQIQLQHVLGFYLDGYSAITLSHLTAVENQIYGYCEAGLYFNAPIESHLKSTTRNHIFNHDISEIRSIFDEVLLGEPKVIMDITTKNIVIPSQAGLATPPVLTMEYYDVRSGEDEQEVIKVEKLTFLFKNRNELEIQEGMLVLPETNLEKIEVLAKYEHENGHVFKTTFEVEIPENKKVNLSDHPKFKDSIKLKFSNEDDAWATTIILKPDCSFIGESYSLRGNAANPTAIHRNEFTGLFKEIKIIDENSYSMKLSDIIYARRIGEKWKEDRKPHTASKALGLHGSKNFVLYTPDQTKANLSNDFLSWNSSADGYSSDKLMSWGLHNLETDEGFFGY